MPAPSRAISDRDEARPAAPRSWRDSTRPLSTSSRLVSISFLPVKGSPIWTDGRFSCDSSPSSWLASTLAPPIPSRPVVEPKRTTACPVVRARARVTRSAGTRPTHIAFTRQLSRYAGVEDRVAADGGDADAVAVVADALDRALEMPVGLAETEPVQQRDGPRAHGDDVADDPADAGGRALERLDRGRVVVALDLEGDRLALAEVDHAGVLARPLQHARAEDGSRRRSRAECL